MLQELNIGVLALTDSAPFVVAQKAGFFEQAGLMVHLEHQPSWSTLRDKLIFGQLDAAQMLSPMPVAIDLGLNGTPRKAMRAPLVVSRGGNSVVVSQAVQELMQALPEGGTLGAGLRAEIAKGKAKRVIGTVFPYSMHTLQLRRWLRSQDVDPDQDVRFHVVPPARMVAALRDQTIDLFCVGEPWGSAAQEEGLGSIVATSQTLWPYAPEKVLGFTADWVQANSELAKKLVDAVRLGCEWLQAGIAQREQAADWLSAMEYVNVPSELIKKALVGVNQTAQSETAPFLDFDAKSSDSERINASLDWMIDETLSAMNQGRQPAMKEDNLRQIFNSL